jgi:hypothetical protein
MSSALYDWLLREREPGFEFSITSDDSQEYTTVEI